VLLLDEPLSNLDAKLREQMRLELKRLQRKLGITTIFVTHDQEESMTTADRMAVLEAGVLQQVGTPHEMFDTPVNRFVAEFVGSTNLLAGRSDNARRVFIADGFGEIPLTGSASGTAISVRPHAITIAESRDAARVWFEGAIEESEFLGECTRCGVRVGPMLLHQGDDALGDVGRDRPVPLGLEEEAEGLKNIGLVIRDENQRRGFRHSREY